MPAVVYTGMTPEDEAQLFSLKQRKRRNMSTHERFKAAVRAKEPEALGIAKILKKYGYAVGPRSSETDYSVQAVAALESVYKRSPERLDTVIKTLHEAWGKEPQANRREVFSAEIIRALDRFMYSADHLDDKRLIAKLKATNPAVLKIRAGQLRAGKGGSGHTSGYMTEVLLQTYASKK